MANKIDRTPEVQFYDWNPKRWLDSDARHELDPVARSIYRDCLDLCYQHGSIPKNLSTLTSKCLVTSDQMETSWPKIARHFLAHKSDQSQLTNKFADLWRRQYFGYVRSQRKRRKDAIDKARNRNEIDNAGSTVVEGSLNGGSSYKEKDTKKTRHEEEKEKEVVKANGGAHDSSAEFQDESRSFFEQAIERVADRLHERHPAVRRCSLKEIRDKLRSIVKPIQGVPAKIAKLEAIDLIHEGWTRHPDWTKEGGKYAKGLGNWLAPTMHRYEIPAPATEEDDEMAVYEENNRIFEERQKQRRRGGTG